MHNLKILHRDLKCANIFIDNSQTYKIGDLNVSKIAKKGLVYTQTGTPYYASPEVWRDEPYDTKSDIWSLGVILYEACSLKPPFRAKDMEGLYQKVQKGAFERIPSKYSDDLFKIIQLCLQVNSSVRPSCKALLNNSLLRKNTVQFIEKSQSEHLDAYQLEENQNLLSTIKVPRNMKHLQSALPKSKYDQKVLNSFDFHQDSGGRSSLLNKSEKNTLENHPPETSSHTERAAKNEILLPRIGKANNPLPHAEDFSHQQQMLNQQQYLYNKNLDRISQISNKNPQRAYLYNYHYGNDSSVNPNANPLPGNGSQVGAGKDASAGIQALKQQIEIANQQKVFKQNQQIQQSEQFL